MLSCTENEFSCWTCTSCKSTHSNFIAVADRKQGELAASRQKEKKLLAELETAKAKHQQISKLEDELQDKYKMINSLSDQCEQQQRKLKMLQQECKWNNPAVYTHSEWGVITIFTLYTEL